MKVRLDRQAGRVELKADNPLELLDRAGLTELLTAPQNLSNSSPAFSPGLSEEGGEAYLRLLDGTVLRFQKSLLKQDCKPEKRARFLAKMAEIRRILLPEKAAVLPEEAIFVEGQAVGHTMRWIPDYAAFRSHSVGDACERWGLGQAARSLLELHDFVQRCHKRGIVLGEINPTNFGMSHEGLVAIDTLSYGTPTSECKTVFEETVDPLLVDNSPTAKKTKLVGSYTADSDWFGFACVACEVLTGFSPYGGIHSEQHDRPIVSRLAYRRAAGLTIFRAGIMSASWDPPKRHWKQLGGGLTSYFTSLFHNGERGVFPRALLVSLASAP